MLYTNMTQRGEGVSGFHQVMKSLGMFVDNYGTCLAILENKSQLSNRACSVFGSNGSKGHGIVILYMRCVDHPSMLSFLAGRIFYHGAGLFMTAGSLRAHTLDFLDLINRHYALSFLIFFLGVNFSGKMEPPL